MFDKAVHRFRGVASWVRQSMLGDPNFFLRQCTNIVHVGANIGEERKLYAERGLGVLWVEPIPSVYHTLVRNIEVYPNQKAMCALLTDRDGDTRQFNVANNGGASSSIFEMAGHRDLWPDVSYIDRIEMTTTTLDRLLAQLDDPPIDAIILDTQGSELLVLQGGLTVLRRARYVKTECADFESYVGCATLDRITEFLAEHGYRLSRKDKIAGKAGVGAYYDVLFKKG